MRIKETNNLLNNLTKEKMSYIEEQKNLQKQIDSINEYNANQEVIMLLNLLLLVNFIYRKNYA